MTFRFARHTNDLDRVKSFYTEVLGFELLGNFENHEGYNGIFIGKPNQDWHLEFTQSDEAASHIFDEDDILVFYPKTIAEFTILKNRLIEKNIETIKSKNPYWNQNGIQFQDPDGYRIIISSLKAV